MVKIKCYLCIREKNREEFDSERVYEGIFGVREWGYCKNCVVEYNSKYSSPCSCCGSLCHNETMAANCDDWFHKISYGLVEDWLESRSKKTDKQTGEVLAGLYVNKCEHFKKYLTPILGDDCKCCGWYCVKESEDRCNYKYCGGNESADEIHYFKDRCMVRKTCEDYWKDKENERKRKNISREEFYAKNINNPKQGFNCSHFEKFSQSEEMMINQLRSENDELQARIRELEIKLANVNLQAQQEQQAK